MMTALPMCRCVVASLALAFFCVPLAADAGDLALAMEKTPPPGAIWLDSLDLGQMTQEWAKPRRGLSVDGKPMRLEGITFPHGVGTHATSRLNVALNGGAKRFFSVIGIDDECPDKGSVTFEIWVDGAKKYDSGRMIGGEPFKEVSVNLAGAGMLTLIVTDAGDGIGHDHADWAGAFIECVPGPRLNIEAVAEPGGALPAIAMEPRDEPEIHAARIVGAGRGRPFLYRIPATGRPPLRYTADGMPPGLGLDAATGILSGTLESTGTHALQVTVSGPAGTATRRLCIVCEERMRALSPPMGWNSWKVWGMDVSDEAIRYAADWLVNTGLASHGFQYVVVDNGWSQARSESGSLLPNEKFPNMPGLVDYVHAKGLKFGLWMRAHDTAGNGGIYDHRFSDAETFELWGVDFVKCVCVLCAGVKRDGMAVAQEEVWRAIVDAMKQARRGIVVAISPSTLEPWKMADAVGADCGRVGTDVGDVWARVDKGGHLAMSEAIFADDSSAAFSRPGHWNDMDMMVVGKVGLGGNLHPCRLTPHEQVSHVTAWCMGASPLMISCDLPELDRFTRALLTNHDVLEVNQDPLGRAATRRTSGTCEVWARPLWDGTLAVAAYNRDDIATTATVEWSVLGLSGTQEVRDLWARKPLGSFEVRCELPLAPHGAALVKVGRPRATECECPPF